MSELSETKKSNALVHRRDDVERAIGEAITTAAMSASIKGIARDAEISEQRAKQLRAEVCDPRASTLILLARRHPELRTILMELMWAEAGDGERSPAQILDAIARMIR